MPLYAEESDPPVTAFAITPNDSNDLSIVTRCLWVGGSGNVRVLFANDTMPVTLNGASGLVPGQIRRVYATGTTATNIVGMA